MHENPFADLYSDEAQAERRQILAETREAQRRNGWSLLFWRLAALICWPGASDKLLDRLDERDELRYQAEHFGIDVARGGPSIIMFGGNGAV